MVPFLLLLKLTNWNYRQQGKGNQFWAGAGCVLRGPAVFCGQPARSCGQPARSCGQPAGSCGQPARSCGQPAGKLR
jgi:hypothetical protein